MALSDEYSLIQIDGGEEVGPRYFPIAASAKVFNGAIVGHAVGSQYTKNFATADGATFMITGVHCTPGVRDNTGGSNGAFPIRVEDGIWGPFKSSAVGGNVVTAAHVDAAVFVEDDNTISLTSQTSTLPGGITVHSVDSDGIYVRFTR